MMTKKHYIQFAQALKDTRPDPSEEIATLQWMRDIKGIIAILARDNSRFDSDRFIAAIGL